MTTTAAESERISNAWMLAHVDILWFRPGNHGIRQLANHNRGAGAIGDVLYGDRLAASKDTIAAEHSRKRCRHSGATPTGPARQYSCRGENRPAGAGWFASCRTIIDARPAIEQFDVAGTVPGLREVVLLIKI